MSDGKRTAIRGKAHAKYSFLRDSDFVHLHLHSEFSLLDGACMIAEIPEAAKKAGHKAVAITDHGVLYGTVDFYKACKKAGIKPIIGCEMYVAPRSMHDKDHNLDLCSCHLVLLVKNDIGYKNLIYLVSKSFTEGFYSKPRIDLDILSKHSEGLIALSACLAGNIPRLIAAGDYDEALSYALRLNGIFGDGNFYLELQDHGLPEQYAVIQGIEKIHKETGIPLVATNDVHYLRKSDAQVHSVLKCIQTNSHLSDGRSEAFGTDEFYFKSTREMSRVFRNHKEALKNTARIAQMCSFDFDFGHLYLPHYRPENGEAPIVYLRSLIEEGFKERIEKGRIVFSDEHPESEYRERIEHELSVIDSMGYTEYYLIVWDFVHYSKTHGIAVGPGRGSGAGSLCAYLVDIVEIDPIAYGLLFERFLNPERISMPDFDIDFPDDKREQAIDYVRSKYGEDKIAQIITFGTMAAKAVLRDVGRVLEVPFDDLDKISALVPQVKDATLEKALETPAFRRIYEENSDIRKLVDISLRLEGMPRHASVHAAGIAITDTPLCENVPLAVNNGVVVTQFAMKNIEELGFLKIDFLAIRYLTVVENCVERIKRSDPSFYLTDIDLNDSATYAMISRGDTDGVFQLEKGGMKRFLVQLKPHSINDVIAAISFYRPGPIDSIPKYLENRRNPARISYASPLLEPILSETYGCIVFQEQVMKIFRSLAGYSLGKADIVRKAISKKKTGTLEAERVGFIEGAAKNGVDEKTAAELFGEIVKFAEYAYNKSHAAAYAILTYRTAFLKCNYPFEYTCALLTSNSFDTSKTTEYISDARSRGITVVAPHVNESEIGFSVSDKKIVFGLGAIRNLGINTAEEIVVEREKNGRFSSVEDFMNRVGKKFTNRRQIEFLVKAGALDGLGPNRHQLNASIDKLSAAFVSSPFGNVEGQVDLFSLSDAEASGFKIEYPPVEEYSAQRLLALEKEAFGVSLSANLLNDYSDHIGSLPSRVMISEILLSADDGNIADRTTASPITVCALVTKCDDKQTRAGAVMTFLKVEDESGEFDVVVFPQQRARFESILKTENVLCLTGKISYSDTDQPKMILSVASLLKKNNDFKETESVSPMKSDRPYMDYPKNNRQSSEHSKLFVRFDLSDEALKKRVFNLISIFNDGKDYALFYDISKNDYDRSIALKCTASRFLVDQLAELVGKENVVVQ